MQEIDLSKQLADLESELDKFESKYGMNTREFFQKFQTGKTDDRMDFVEWASLAQMAQNLSKRIEIISGAIVPAR